MKLTRISILLIVALVLTSALPAGMTGGTANAADDKSPNSDEDANDQPEPTDIGPKLRQQANDKQFQNQLQKQLKKQAEKIKKKLNNRRGLAPQKATYEVGSEKYFLGYDTENGYYVKKYTLKAIGENVEVWLSNDNSWPEDDERPVPKVTQDQIDQLVQEFDNNIYPNETEFFGQPDTLTGESATLDDILGLPEDYYVTNDGETRVMLLIDNFRDANYYDPDYPFYVSGFFSPVYESYFNRNIVNIDTYNLAKNTQDAYGTLAHEFQHLIHSDNDPNEGNWLNEGMSDLAEYIVGYGHPMGHINFYLNHPENSLVTWDEYLDAPTGPETLGDYGQAYLLELYLLEHYGEDFIQQLAHSSANGIKSVDQVLAEVDAGIDFGELFRNFSIALAIDSPGIGGNLFSHNKAMAKFKKHVTAGKSFKNFLNSPGKVHQLLGDQNKGRRFTDGFDGFSLAVTVNNLRLGGDVYKFDSIDLGVNYGGAAKYNKEGVPAWGTDYIKLDSTDKVKNVAFDLMDFQPIPWEVVHDPLDTGHGAVYWSSNGNLIDNKLVVEADLTDANSPTLEFDHYYNIEEKWDYGMVQVSTDGGQTWNSLSNEHTRSDVSPEGLPKIKNNLPGFTGTNGKWTHETFDLSQFAGQKVLIAFRYLTDWATNNSGWYVDNIEIPEVEYSRDGSSLEGVRSLDEILGRYINYQVSFVNKREFAGGLFTLFKVLNYDPFNVSEDTLKELRRLRTNNGETYMIFWHPARFGNRNPVDYSYEVNVKHDRGHHGQKHDHPGKKD